MLPKHWEIIVFILFIFPSPSWRKNLFGSLFLPFVAIQDSLHGMLKQKVSGTLSAVFLMHQFYKPSKKPDLTFIQFSLTRGT